jgi:hypothetical protein
MRMRVHENSHVWHFYLLSEEADDENSNQQQALRRFNKVFKSTRVNLGKQSAEVEVDVAFWGPAELLYVLEIFLISFH